MEWTEQMLETMMHEVYQKKLHLMANKAGSKGAWEEFLDHLFEQRDFIPLKAAYYQRGNPRNIRKKYQDTLDLIKRDLETGNQSGKEGESGISWWKISYPLTQMMDVPLALPH